MSPSQAKKILTRVAGLLLMFSGGRFGVDRAIAEAYLFSKWNLIWKY
ncbi:MAG: hypothetical protein O2877_00390 [bacterium]|nr:hypothetical protein [bacterium]